MSGLDQEIERITVRVAGLEIEVRRSRGSVEPDLGFEFVEPASGASTEQTLEDTVLEAATAGTLGALDLPQLESFARSLTASGDWTPKARVARAYRAGLSARRCLDRSEYCPLATPAIAGLRNCIYIVLTCPRHPDGGWTRSYRTFAAAVKGSSGEIFDKKALCHSFASQAEGDAYLLGASRGWPARLAE